MVSRGAAALRGHRRALRRKQATTAALTTPRPAANTSARIRLIPWSCRTRTIHPALPRRARNAACDGGPSSPSRVPGLFMKKQTGQCSTAC